MKDHQKAQLVNDLTATAKKYATSQQLRERIKATLFKYLNRGSDNDTKQAD